MAIKLGKVKANVKKAGVIVAALRAVINFFKPYVKD